MNRRECKQTLTTDYVIQRLSDRNQFGEEPWLGVFSESVGLILPLSHSGLDTNTIVFQCDSEGSVPSALATAKANLHRLFRS